MNRDEKKCVLQGSDRAGQVRTDVATPQEDAGELELEVPGHLSSTQPLRLTESAGGIASYGDLRTAATSAVRKSSSVPEAHPAPGERRAPMSLGSRRNMTAADLIRQRKQQREIAATGSYTAPVRDQCTLPSGHVSQTKKSWGANPFQQTAPVPSSSSFGVRGVVLGRASTINVGGAAAQGAWHPIVVDGIGSGYRGRRR